MAALAFAVAAATVGREAEVELGKEVVLDDEAGKSLVSLLT